MMSLISLQQVKLKQSLCQMTQLKDEVLSQSIKIVKCIRNSVLNTRLLSVICGDMGSDHQHLLYHAEVRW
jgi:hypothetical protein